MLHRGLQLGQIRGGGLGHDYHLRPLVGGPYDALGGAGPVGPLSGRGGVVLFADVDPDRQDLGLRRQAHQAGTLHLVGRYLPGDGGSVSRGIRTSVAAVHQVDARQHVLREMDV